MKDTITFNDLPQAVAEINRKLDILLADRTAQTDSENSYMTMEQLREYLPDSPARQTVYQWISHRKIPFEKYGKRLYFRKLRIDDWIENGRMMR